MTQVSLIVALRHAFVIRMSEWMLAFVMATWGLILLFPEARFADPAWAGFRVVVEENTLGVLFLLGGFIRLAVLSLNGAYRPMYYVRAWMALTASVAWFAVCLGFLSAGVFGVWLATYPYFLIFDVVNTFRAVLDAAEVERQRIIQGQVNGG